MRFRLTILCILATCYIGAKAQSVAVKTNMLYDVLGVASLGVEATASKHSSFCLLGSYNPLKYGGAKWKNFSVQSEYRYWFHSTFTGPYLSANVCYGGFNIDKLHLGGLYGKHRQGHFWGGGIGGGYSMKLSSRCNLDFCVDLDVVRCKYDRYREGDLPYLEGQFYSTQLLPIGTGITFIYILK